MNVVSVFLPAHIARTYVCYIRSKLTHYNYRSNSRYAHAQEIFKDTRTARAWHYERTWPCSYATYIVDVSISQLKLL